MLTDYFQRLMMNHVSLPRVFLKFKQEFCETPPTSDVTKKTFGLEQQFIYQFTEIKDGQIIGYNSVFFFQNYIKTI